MCPVLSHGEDFAEQMGTSIIVGATQEIRVPLTGAFG